MFLEVTSKWTRLIGLFILSSSMMPSSSGLRSVVAGRPSEFAGPDAASVHVAQSAYGQLPLYFEPDAGLDPLVRYFARGSGYALFLTDSEAAMVLSRESWRRPQDVLGKTGDPPKTEQAVVRMKLLGARRTARWEALDRQPGVSNYFVGNDPTQWRRDVPHYGRVAARGVYPGIDFVCYGNRRQLEYDLDVAPGADPGQVQLAWEGADSLRVNEDGDLVLATRLGDVVQRRPRVYQEWGGRRVEVASKYVLSGNRVRFEIARHDRNRQLVIDPLVLVYSGYVGGGGDDEGLGIAVDASGAAYVTGTTTSTTVAGAQNEDAFVIKLTPSGELAYSTYIGGTGNDFASGIAVDGSGSAYITGGTDSTNFPTRSGYEDTYQGGKHDAFVTKLTPSGNALVYSTYLGGMGDEVSLGIAVDGSGSAYVAGYTDSHDFPVRSAYQTAIRGQEHDAFVTKLSPAGSALVYSTYLGGDRDQGVTGIAVDGDGFAYVTGFTFSADFPIQTPFQWYLHGTEDAFVTKLAPTGNALVYSTYLGGYGVDVARGIAVDGTGSAYVVGSTDSRDFPTRSAFQWSLAGTESAFVTKLGPEGNALVYSTYLGASGGIVAGGISAGAEAYGVAVDGAGSAYVTGFTSSATYPTREALQSSLEGAEDAFVTKLAPAGTALVYSTYLGGNGEDRGAAIAVDGAGATYVTGWTGSYDFPTKAPGSSVYKGGKDVFVTKLLEPPGAPVLSAPADDESGVSTSPVLTWSASFAASSYDVYFGRSASPPLVANTTAASFSPGTLDAGTSYYWQVVARNAAGTAASATRSFTTAVPQVPMAPALLSPGNGATGVSPTTALNWSAAAGATSYDVYFGTSSPPPLVTNTTSTSYTPPQLALWTTYHWQIVARNSAGTANPAASSFTTGALTTGLHFRAVTPCRVVDTRSPNGPFGGPAITSVTPRSFPIPNGGCGIPSTAQAYSLNVTVVPQGPLSYLTLGPSGQPQPFVSTLNSLDGAVVANAAIVPAGADGGVSVYATNTTEVILDINGYFDDSSGTDSYWFYPATPCRVADTRGAAGQFGGPAMYANETRDFPIPLGTCPIPATARAYSMNVTAVPDPGVEYLSFLTTWPTGEPRPNVSTLNSWTGRVVANAALVPAGTNQSISVFVTNPANVILDTNGYFAGPGAAGALSFYPVAPCRVADTRNGTGPFGGPEMGGNTTRSFTIPDSPCNIPDAAVAYSLNVTVVPDGYLGYLSVWPTGSAQPTVSTLNSWDGAIVANAAIVPAGTGGAIEIFVSNPTHVILDINGYFAP